MLARVVRPTAIFAGADIVAMGVLDAMNEVGLTAPGDNSVAGYDNHLRRVRATVDQAGHQMGADAARLLLGHIADRTRPTAQVKLSPSLVSRQTTAAPPS